MVYSPADEYRPPNWRMANAAALLAAAGGVLPPADELTHQLAWLMADEQEFVENPEALAAVRAAHGPLARAWTLNAGLRAAENAAAVTGLSLAAAEVEALVLAGAPTDRVAEITRLDGPTVDAYERAFFDVRGRLGRTAWICGEVLKHLNARDFVESNNVTVVVEKIVLNLARAYGYHTKSLEMIRYFLSGMDGRSVRRAARRGGTTAAALEDLRGAIGYKAILATRCVHPTQKAFRSVLEMCMKMGEETRQAGAATGGGDNERYKDAVEKLWAAAKLGISYPADAIPPQPVLALPAAT